MRLAAPRPPCSLRPGWRSLPRTCGVARLRIALLGHPNHRIDLASGRQTAVFSHLPFKAESKGDTSAEGVACTVCHQIQPTGMGTTETYNGDFHAADVNDSARVLYGPYPVDAAKVAPLHLSGSGYALAESKHIREARMSRA